MSTMLQEFAKFLIAGMDMRGDVRTATWPEWSKEEEEVHPPKTPGVRPMTWQQIYPERSTVFIGRDKYTAKHNPHFPGIDLYQGELRVMTVCPDYLPQVANGVRLP